MPFNYDIGWNDKQLALHGRKRLKLHVHHKKSVSEILAMRSIETLAQALKCRELRDIRNGITVCEDCHGELENEVRKLEHDQRREEQCYGTEI